MSESDCEEEQGSEPAKSVQALQKETQSEVKEDSHLEIEEDKKGDFKEDTDKISEGEEISVSTGGDKLSNHFIEQQDQRERLYSMQSDFSNAVGMNQSQAKKQKDLPPMRRCNSDVISFIFKI